MTQHITIADVAKAAGVSVTTVSRILNGRFEKMRPETRARVEQTIKKLNFVPAASARRLRQDKSNVIGIVVGDIANPFSSLLAKGIDDVLQAAGYDILLMNTNDSTATEARALQCLYQQRVDGIIVQPDSRQFSQYEPIIANNIPLVVVDREVDDQPSSIGKVTSANRDSCYCLGRILADQGYDNILTISAHFADASGQIPRIAGLKAAAADNGLSYHNIETRGHDRQWLAREFFRQFNALHGRTVAISLMGPVLFDLLSIFKELDLSFPTDLGLVSFDDWEWLQYMGKGIFLLKQDMELMGNLAAHKFLAQINAKNTISSTTFVPVEFVAHESL